MVELLVKIPRKKIADGNRGKFVSQETRDKLRIKSLGEGNGMYGKNGSLNPFYGKHHTKDVRKKLSQNAKLRCGDKNPSAKKVVQLNLDGGYINTFSCIKEASKVTGIPVYVISRDCRKLVKKHNKYKFVWMYLNEYEEKGVV